MQTKNIPIHEREIFLLAQSKHQRDLKLDKSPQRQKFHSELTI